MVDATVNVLGRVARVVVTDEERSRLDLNIYCGSCAVCSQAGRWPRRCVAEMDHFEHGRECYRRRAWVDAYDALVCADRATALDVEDLDRLASLRLHPPERIAALFWCAGCLLGERWTDGVYHRHHRERKHPVDPSVITTSG